MLDVKKLLTKLCLRINPNQMFSLKQDNGTSMTLAAGANNNGSFSVTKSGYRPIGIVGYSIGYGSGDQTKINISTIRLSASSDGSGTVSYRACNLGAGSATFTVYADVLWAQIGGVLLKGISVIPCKGVAVC